MRRTKKKYGIKIHPIDFIRTPYHPGNVKAFCQLVRLMKREKYDFVHCNTPVGGLVGRIAAKTCRVGKVIYQAHGFHFYEGAPKINWLLYYPIEKWLAHAADALITINREDFQLAQSQFRLRNNGKVYYVPGVGIDTSAYSRNDKVREAKRQELGLQPDEVALISVGELNGNKNNGVIISAMEKLRNPQLHYILCGVGEKQTELQEQADQAGLQDNVHFLGYRNDVKDLYEAADCFVMPSFREGLSRSMMEAMASGLPCIASKIRGNTDLLADRKGGFLCEATDVDGFAAAIRTLQGDSAMCDSMARYNVRRIQDFDVAVVTEQTVKVYSEVLGVR